MHPLDGPHLKLARAEHHLEFLEQAVQEFRELHPPSTCLKFNAETLYYELKVKAGRKPPILWGPIIGDFAHNARSALDLLVYQLSALPDDDTRRKRLQFPIVDTKKGYLRNEGTYLACVSDTHRAIIKFLQPYQGRDGFEGDPLGMLAKINNADKHRIIHTVEIYPGFESIGFKGTRLGKKASFEMVGDGIITEDYTVIARISLPDTVEVNMNPQVLTDIQFGQSSSRVEGRPVLSTLKLILDHVEEILGIFEPEFP
jgi:hypothetical protein